MAKIKVGTTTAGRLFLESIQERFGTETRFTRGRAYFSKGNIKKLYFDKFHLHAKVKGSYRNYQTEFEFVQVAKSQEKILEYFRSNIVEQSSLLNGELSENFFDWCEDEEIPIFISQITLIEGFGLSKYNNYSTHCDCPDFYSPSSPCKHIFGVWYALCVEIDNNPTLLLKMHGVEIEDIVSSQSISQDVPYPIELVFKDKFTPTNSTTEPLEIIHQDDATKFINSLLPSNPPFYPVDFKSVLSEFYKESKLRFSDILAPIQNEHIEKIERLFKESRIEIVIDTTMQTNKAIIKNKIFRQEDVIVEMLDGYIMDRNKLGCSMDLITFVKLFLSFKCERGDAYYRYFYQLSRVAYLLINANAFIPSVISEKSKSRLFITYTPLHRESFSKQLSLLKPNAISSIRQSQRGEFLDEESGSTLFLSGFFSDYVYHLQFVPKRSSIQELDITKTFFKGKPFSQKGAGRAHIDRAISNTFTIFDIAKSRYKLHLQLDIDEDNRYKLSLFVKDDDLNSSITFDKALEQDETKELLKLISPIKLIFSHMDRLISGNYISLDRELFEEFILEKASLLNSIGVEIILPRELHNLIKPQISLSIKSKKVPNSFLDLQKILEYDWVIAIGEHQVSVDEFLALVKEQGQIISYKDSFITLTPDELKNLIANAKKKPKITPFDVLREKFANNLFYDSTLDEFFKKLLTPRSVTIPKTLNASLREYQKRGVEWAISNLLNNFGVILADDMGLGKTIQTIAILLYLYEKKYAKEKSLVVVPTSLLNNWQHELQKFAPSLSYSLYYGQGRKIEASQIIITTYETLKRDENLKKENFDIVIIDEAQKIKNPQTQAAITVKEIKAPYKIALSGTPVENSLSELWSIFDFSMCGYLGELNTFISKYAKPIEIEKDLSVAKKLQDITSPFMLRRLKTDKNIISDLPDKIVIDEYISLSPVQAAQYQNVIDTTMKKLDTLEPNERFGLIFKLITELKQICNHPRNFDKSSDMEASLSGKTELLLELLETIVAKGEKVLIFTQYVEMAKILAHIIEKEMLIEPLMLDGSMSKNAREKVVKSFEEQSEYPIFILSLKAGGVGLNLTSATNVIHYDLWFNPAVENQATDRAFRIGQKRNVFVYRFITQNSFEEKIDNMIKSKQALGEMSVSVGEKNLSQMSNDEIKTIFKI